MDQSPLLHVSVKERPFRRRTWSFCEDHAEPESASAWRVDTRSTALEVTRNSYFTGDSHDGSPPNMAGHSVLLDSSVQQKFRSAVEDEFRSAARNMLASLVDEHERILAKHLHLVIEGAVNPNVDSMEEQEAALHRADEHMVQTPQPVYHSSESSLETCSVDGPPCAAPRLNGAPPRNSLVQHQTGSYASQRSLLRLTTGSFASGAPEAWAAITEPKRNSALRLGRSWCRQFQESLRLKEDIFEAIVGIAIILDLVSMGVSARFSRSWSGWQVMDLALAVFFTAELLRKICVWGCNRFSRRGAWRKNIMEILLVGLTWVDVAAAKLISGSYSSNFQLVLLFVRLLRVLRVFRVNELFTMVNGVIGSCKTLTYSLVLISLPLYCVALVLTETLGRSAGELGSDKELGPEMFGNLEDSLFTVFRCFVAGDCTSKEGQPIFLTLTNDYGWAPGMLYCVVQFGMTFGLYNVITAIYVEKSVDAAKFNELALKRRRFQDRQFFEKRAKEMLTLIWKFYFGHSLNKSEAGVHVDLKAVGTLQLTRGFFDELCKQPSFVSILRSLDISEDDQLDLFDTLDVECRGSIDPMSLVIGVSKLRGDARKADIVSMALMLQGMQNKLADIEELLSTSVTSISNPCL